jgi:hypothetical protein
VGFIQKPFDGQTLVDLIKVASESKKDLWKDLIYGILLPQTECDYIILWRWTEG